MKTLLLCVALAWWPGGERERGLQLYRDGKFPEAVAAFRAAIEQDGDSAELQWNLALAAWRAGDLPTAETAAEKYAALAKDARKDLHAGLLGAVRHDEALALSGKGDELLAAGSTSVPPTAAPGAASQPEDPLPVFEAALAKATQAKDHFVRGAATVATPELVRNTERALRTIDELQKKIDELKKQREQQKKEQEQKKDEEQKKPEDKKDEPKSDEKKNDKPDDKKDEPKPDEKPPEGEPKGDDKPKDEKKDEKQGDPQKSEGEPKGEGEQKPEPKPPEGQDQKPGSDSKQGKDGADGKGGEQPASGEPQSGKPRSDAPGEVTEPKELTPEQTQRLLEKLQQTDDKQKAFRARARSVRPAVERDW